jgi:hypothetical protein
MKRSDWGERGMSTAKAQIWIESGMESDTQYVGEFSVQPFGLQVWEAPSRSPQSLRFIGGYSYSTLRVQRPVLSDI